MRNTLKLEIMMFITVLIAVFFASKALVDMQGVDFFETIFSIMDSSELDAKSIDWFVAHPADAQHQIEHCQKDSRLQISNNCRNADSGYQIYKQINTTKTL